MVRIHFLAALLLLVLPFPLFGQSRTEGFDRIFLRALEMQKAGDLIGAIDASSWVSSRTRSRNTTRRSRLIRRTRRSG